MENLTFSVSRITTDGSKWERIGSRRVNPDGSLNLYLFDKVSISGPARLHMRAVQPPPAKPELANTESA